MNYGPLAHTKLNLHKWKLQIFCYLVDQELIKMVKKLLSKKFTKFTRIIIQIRLVKWSNGLYLNSLDKGTAHLSRVFLPIFMAFSPIRASFRIPRGPSTESRSARNSSPGARLSFVERICRGFADDAGRDAPSPIPRKIASCNLRKWKRKDMENAHVKWKTVSHSRVNVVKRIQQWKSTRKLSHVRL